MDARRYLVFLAAAVVLIAGLLGGINWAVDPYLFFGAARQPGINDAKPAANNREAFMKAYQVSRVQARTVVLASSRTDIGLDASDPAWPRSAAPVYNLSLAGVDLGRALIAGAQRGCSLVAQARWWPSRLGVSRRVARRDRSGLV